VLGRRQGNVHIFNDQPSMRHIRTCSAMRMEAAALPPLAVMAAEIWPRPLAVASALRKIASASPEVQQAALLSSAGVPVCIVQVASM
jgi:hypothetical protein